MPPIYAPRGAPWQGGGNPSSRSYRCGSKVRPGSERCSYPGGGKKDWLESAVIDTVASILGSREHHEQLLAHLDAALADGRSASSGTGTRIDAQIRDATGSRDRLVKAVADGTRIGDEARDTLSDVGRTIARLDSQRDVFTTQSRMTAS